MIFNVSELSNFTTTITGRTPNTLIAIADDIVSDIKSGDVISKAEYVMAFYNSCDAPSTIGVTFTE